MKYYLGDNNFGHCFNFYKWSAPFFSTPEEVLGYIESLNLYGSVLKKINIIGCGYDAGNTNCGLMYQKLREAGLEPEYDENDENWYRWYDDYPHKDKILVPWCVSLCEPIQFVFEDGNTLELLPVESGGARVGFNSIPQNISDGLNNSDFDGNLFFKEIIGRSFESFCVRIIETSTRNINKYSLSGKNPYVEKRDEYNFLLSFGYPYEMTLVMGGDSWYLAKLSGGANNVNVPYKRVRMAKKQHTNNQITIINGRDCGGTFWIVPINREKDEDYTDWIYDGYGISIDISYVEEFLPVFLYRYFDETIQERDEYDDEGFDWYGINLYRFEAVEKMVTDIRNTCHMLLYDYDNPALDEIKSNFSWSHYTDKPKNKLTDARIDELIKIRVSVAVDFYKRFCSRMEDMLRLADKDTISFAGP